MRALIPGMISSPPLTASAPPGQKSFCMSITIRASVIKTSFWQNSLLHGYAPLGRSSISPLLPCAPHGPKSAHMYIIAALYHFCRLENPAARQEVLLDLCRAEGISGSLILAYEGINGTIAGSREGIDAVLAHLRSWPGCEALEHKESTSSVQPFGRLKVRLKREIVTMGQPDVDPRARVGHYVDPVDWNELISQPDVAVIDTRNDYEVAIGTFQGAVDPETAS